MISGRRRTVRARYDAGPAGNGRPPHQAEPDPIPDPTEAGPETPPRGAAPPGFPERTPLPRSIPEEPSRDRSPPETEARRRKRRFRFRRGARPAPPPAADAAPGLPEHSLRAGLRRAGAVLARSWPGRILLVVGAVYVLALAGALPRSLASDAGLVFAITGAAVLVFFGRDLLRWLLFPVRRRLAASYLLLGLLPVALLILFFLLGAYVALGEFGLFSLRSNLAARSNGLFRAADRILIRAAPDATDSERLAAVEAAAAESRAFAPGAEAFLYEVEDGRITRVAASTDESPFLAVGAAPDWTFDAYEGAVQTPGGAWYAVVSPGPAAAPPFSPSGGSPPPDAPPETSSRFALVAAPITPFVHRSADDEELVLRTVWPLWLDGDAQDPPQARPVIADAGRAPFSIPWVLLLNAAPWNPDLGGGTVAVTFGFAPIQLIQQAARGLEEPLALNDRPIGSSLFVVLVELALIFLLIECAALMLGIRLARSITRSVEALSRGTERVRSGNFGQQVQIRSRDQLGRLAASFNIMTAKIADDLDRVQRAAVLEQEMETARQAQALLLPPEGSVTVPGFSLAAVCRPATEVGGDYYDLIRLSPSRLGVVIADVAGTGARAAFYMAELKGLMQALSRAHHSPRQVLVEANRVLHDTLDSRTFITITYGVFDAAERTVTFARAGHSPVIRLRPNAGEWPASDALAPDGLGVALDPGPVFDSVLKEQTEPLEPGETWLLYTDGVSEAMNAESDMFGEERLMRLLEDNAFAPPAELQQTVEDAVLRFTGAETQTDDLTMVLVRVD